MTADRLTYFRNQIPHIFEEVRTLGLQLTCNWLKELCCGILSVQMSHVEILLLSESSMCDLSGLVMIRKKF